MYNKILVPLDGSKQAEAVLPYTKFLASGLQLPVELLHVNDPETAAPAIHPSRGADYLKQVASACLGSLSLECCVKNGAAAEIILDTACADSGTLLAMATHGQSGGQRWVLGRVAQKMLQASKNPLILIRPNDESLTPGEACLSRLIVPLDGSRLAEQIFPHIVYLGTKLRLPAVLIRTYALPTASYFFAAHVSPPEMAALAEKMKQEIGDYLQTKVKELCAQGLAKVSTVLVEGSGPAEIIDLARKTSGNMVAMSTHGRSGMGRWVLGSVTDRVVSNCGAPVLVIRPKAVVT